MNNSKILESRNKVNDEYYTYYTDIAKEVSRYAPQFEGKAVYCNCDDFYRSNFIKFFGDNFDIYKLKALYATGFINPSIFDDNTKAMYMCKTAQKTIVEPCRGTGDCFSDECKEIAKKADIIVTNPPFSCFNEYLQMLIDLDKKFLIMCSGLALNQKGNFELFKEHNIKIGYTFNELTEFGPRQERMCIGWLTNLEVERTPYTFTKNMNPDKFPRFDNYPCINVDRLADIPNNYYEEMGVPVTFLQYYDPDKWELIGNESTCKLRHFTVNGKAKFCRIIIKRKRQ